jgi:hypothetical protein
MQMRRATQTKSRHRIATTKHCEFEIDLSSIVIETIRFALQKTGQILRPSLASSVSFGSVGGPSSGDSGASTVGQIVGSGIAGASGEILRDAGIGTTGLGLVAEVPSAGTSTVLAGAGVAAAAAGTTVVAGAAQEEAAASLDPSVSATVKPSTMEQ